MMPTIAPHAGARIETDADQDAALEQASMDIDSVHWIGEVYDAAQANNWPRVRSHYERDLIDPWTALQADQPVASIPRAVALGTALQAATIIQRASGVDPTAHVMEAAARGVVAHSGGGMSETLDGRIARSSFAALCEPAQRMLRVYLATGGHAL